MKKIILVLWLLVHVTKSHEHVEWMDVTIEQGRVRGYHSDGRYSFMGIPYAAAPTGDKRFKDPLPPPTLTDDIFEATNTVMCPQIFLDGVYYGTEDCLVVNVFVPDGIRTGSLPVLVHIHGGAFILGLGGSIPGNKLIRDQNIIIVTINYRLGALGFLCTRTEDAPGNAGLKDQVAGLRWVKNNIRNFGGDPDDVTLYGNSAGSASVELLMLSSTAEGLFNKVIVESGSAIAGWALGHHPLDDARAMVKTMGHEHVDDIDELIHIYKHATPEELVFATNKHMESSAGQILFTPCIEKKLHGTTSFLTDSPMNIIKFGHYNPMPMMIAYMNMEGLLFVDRWLHAGWEEIFNENISAFFNDDLTFETNEEENKVSEQVRNFYIERTENDLRAFIDFKTDMLFSYSAIESAQLHTANSAPVYLMEFSYHDTSGTVAGASHSELYMHVFEFELKGVDGELVADRLTTLFGNFIKYGNPTPTTSSLLPMIWPRVTSAAVNCMLFADQLNIIQSPQPERFQFWHNIYDQYYNDAPLPDGSESVDEYIEVTLEQGVLRGFLSSDQRRYSFLGIPFATPPTGKNRFKAPSAPPPWSGILNATNTVRCPQIMLGILYTGDEDCLQINVFVPAKANSYELPVLVYTHGGAFVIGSGDVITGDRLLGQNIIIVTFNYRLGALGYLCLRTKDAPGNAASKDQVAALRWVQNNIHHFGGDPSKVTLFGTSAGSVSVDLLALSHVTKGLFDKIIVESGSAIGGWAASYDPINDAKTIAKEMGFENVDDEDALAEFYVNATPEDLVRALNRHSNDVPAHSAFRPCIEIDMDGSAFLTDTPMNIMRKGNYTPVPVMIIYMDMEGIMFVANWLTGWNTLFRENFSDFLPPDLSFKNDIEKEAVAEYIKQFYLNRTETEIRAFIDVQTDLVFFYNIVESARLHSRLAPVYLMEFSYHDATGMFDGAGHADFYLHAFEIWLKGEHGDLAADRITNLMGNFIKFANPVPETTELIHVSWPTVSSTELNYMSFGENLSIRQSPLPERYEMLREVYDKYYSDVPLPEVPDNLDDYLEIALVQGDVRGFLSEDRRSYSFLGIPYAAPPTGQNRFKAPLPATRWSGVRNATNTVQCPQMIMPNAFFGNEDCLIINVFVPTGVQPDKLPVIVYVHGGAFVMGTGDTFTENTIKLAQQAIFVTFNYRIGPLGFLCLRIDDAPGNAGLKDQVAALKWVQNNIGNFGGNPSDVTLYGTSAGSVAVELLATSRSAEGMFHKVILESGSAISGWAISYDPIESAKTAAVILGYDNVDDINTLADIYKSATAEELVSATYQHYMSSTSQILFRPCVESTVTAVGEEFPFLTDSPINITKSGNYKPKPTMIAYMDMEGLMFLPFWNFGGWETVFQEDIGAFLNDDLILGDDAEKDNVAQQIRDFYIDRTENDLRAFIDFKTDMLFSYGAIESARLHTANSAPVYLMEFSYHDTSGTHLGADHGDFYRLVFGRQPSQSDAVGAELASDRITTLLMNFIKYGDPTPIQNPSLPSWPHVTEGVVNYLSFADELSIRQSPIAERDQFWRDIYYKFYNPVPPPDQEPGSGRRLSSSSLIVFLSFLSFVLSYRS